MGNITIKPLNSAPGYSGESFPVMKQLPAVRSAFERAADDTQNAARVRAVQPWVYAMPLDGIIQHAEEGDAGSEGFQKPNALIRTAMSESATKNNFKDLEFSIKPSEQMLDGGTAPAQYLLKIKLPGSQADWKDMDPSSSVTIRIGKSEARYPKDVPADIITMHVRIDPKVEEVDHGFTDFASKTAKPAPYVATFQVPDFIAIERLLEGAEDPIKTPRNFQGLDIKRGSLNIILPVREHGTLKPGVIPGLGQGPA